MAPAFDPFRQTVLVKVPGEGEVPVPIQQFDAFMKYGIRICINFSSQIGASFALFVVLLLLTRPEKRLTPIFALNALALLFNVIRSILQCVYFTGPFYNAYAQFFMDFSRVPISEYGASIAGVVFTLLLVICLECSLVLQLRAVCAAMTRWKQLLVLLTSTTVALVAIGFRLALTIANCIYIVRADAFNEFQWLAAASNYAITASICCSSLVFVTKLGFALKERRRLGMRQFGPMQIIFIMGCQTLFIPAMFSVLQNFTAVPELGSQTLTVVALFLPLSSMWASRSIEGSKSSSLHLDHNRQARIPRDNTSKEENGLEARASKTSISYTLETDTTNSTLESSHKQSRLIDDLDEAGFRKYAISGL